MDSRITSEQGVGRECRRVGRACQPRCQGVHAGCSDTVGFRAHGSKGCSDAGCPKGRLSSVTKLSGKDDLIREYLDKKIPQSVIARLLNVHQLTVRPYIRTRKLQKPSVEKL